MKKQNLNEVLEEDIKKKLIKSDVIIYGTGEIAKEVYSLLINKNYNIKCFINKNLSYNNEVEGLAEIKLIEDINNIMKLEKNTTIIIAIFNPYADIHQIVAQLNAFGFKDIIYFTELIDIFPDELSEKMYLNKRDELVKDKDKILSIENIWNDKKSKELYQSIVKFRVYKDYKYLLSKDSLKEQYFPNDIEEIYNQDNIRLVDCGAFDGDTIVNFSNKNKKLESIIAFEPDIHNYKKLINRLSELKNKKNILEISAFPCAVYSDSVQLKFSMQGYSGSNISNSGLNIVQCVAIDQCISDFKPTYIKMDIEGAEYDALLGAKDTICRWKPNLAICLYHKPTDLYRIPLLINSWGLGYKFYLRMYYYSAFELVLYATV